MIHPVFGPLTILEFILRTHVHLPTMQQLQYQCRQHHYPIRVQFLVQCVIITVTILIPDLTKRVFGAQCLVYE